MNASISTCVSLAVYSADLHAEQSRRFSETLSIVIKLIVLMGF